MNPESGAAVHETHIGIVLLLGDRAYKLKKPVRTAFCDFSSTDLRRAALERELALNRRLAPDCYLGLGEFTGPGDDEPEPVLVMRRMPADRRLSTLVADGHDVRVAVRAIGRLVARFHADAPRTALDTAAGEPDAVTARWEDNLTELAPFAGRPLDPDLLDEAAALARDYLAGREPLFTERVRRGHVVDGHGDLLADDVFCLDDGPRLLDCLDFDDRLRRVDGIDDIAFLAMDLERLGSPDAAQTLLATYREFSGDTAPASLADHYIAYRALVRCKVACLRHEQGDDPAADLARTHLDLAVRRLRAAAVRLAIVGGLPGVGKSTVATGLAGRTGAVVLSSDRLRKELAGLDPTRSAAAGYREGIYSPAHTDATYTELLYRAGLLLARGESVVLDASWTDRRWRDTAADLARHARAAFLPLRCRTDSDTAADRIRTRAPNPSDATPPIAREMAGRVGTWPDATTVWTTGTVHDSVEAAARAWAQTGPASTDMPAGVETCPGSISRSRS